MNGESSTPVGWSCFLDDSVAFVLLRLYALCYFYCTLVMYMYSVCYNVITLLLCILKIIIGSIPDNSPPLLYSVLFGQITSLYLGTSSISLLISLISLIPLIYLSFLPLPSSILPSPQY